jgi:hypothetical protein
VSLHESLHNPRKKSWATKGVSQSDRFLDIDKEILPSMPQAPRRIVSPVAARDVLGRDGKVQKKKSKNAGTTNTKTSAKESSFEVSKCGTTHTGLGPSGAASAQPARDFGSSDMSKAKEVESVQKKAVTSLSRQKQQDLSSRTWNSGMTSTTLQTKKSSNKTTGRPQSAIFTSGAIKASSIMNQYNLDQWNSDSDSDSDSNSNSNSNSDSDSDSDSDLEVEDKVTKKQTPTKKKQTPTSPKPLKQKTEAVVASKGAVGNQEEPAKQKTSKKKLIRYRPPLQQQS